MAAADEIKREVRRCDRCVHFQFANPPDPFTGIKLASKKVVELRSKWRQEMVSRARLEYQKLISGEPFNYEPIALAWCRHFSKAADDPDSAVSQRLFVPCDRQNPSDDCEQFVVGDHHG
jgi:hypothetical protein